MEKEIYRCAAYVNTAAIEQNIENLKQKLNPGVLAMAVVKANAYGHGAVKISRLIEGRVDYFGVATIDEALELRNAGIAKPILVLSYVSQSEYADAVTNSIALTIYSATDAKALSQVALELGLKAKVHLSVDTGMGRIGFSPTAESADEVKKIMSLEGLAVVGLFSHFACADTYDHTATEKQVENFDAFIKMLEERDIYIPIKHICNSAATILGEKQYDMCRLGVAMYGLYPSVSIKEDRITLVPAMQVCCRIIHVKNVPQGFKIGYGHTFCAEKEMRIATVSVGYADGFNRSLSNKGYLLIDGKVARVVGNVCMDQLMIDVTDIPDVTVGDRAVILGSSCGSTITAEELGAMAGSFNYEVVCNFASRVKRVYI